MTIVELKSVLIISDNTLNVVSKVDLTINEIEFVLLVGLWGCGKSTTPVYWCKNVDLQK